MSTGSPVPKAELHGVMRCSVWVSCLVGVWMLFAAAPVLANEADTAPPASEAPEPPTPAQQRGEALDQLIERGADGDMAPDTDAEPEELEPPEDWVEPALVERRHEPNSCRQLPDDDDEMVDWAREQIEETVCSAALWFDGLFGDHRNVEAARGAYGRLETSVEYSEFYGFKTRTRFRLRVDLPNLEDRVSVFIGRDSDDNLVRDRSEGFALRSEFPQIDDRDQFFAGFGYALPSNRRFRTDIKVGVRSITSPRAFVQSRTEYLAYADDVHVVQLRLTPFYSTRDGLGVTPGIDISRVLSPRLLGRWSNVATYSETTLGWDWRSALVLYQGFGWQRGLAYEAFVRGVTETEVRLREYGLRTVYRQPVLSGRLYLQPLLGYSWPKEEPDTKRRGAYLVGVGLELPFGKNPDIPPALDARRADAEAPTDADSGIELSPAAPEPDDQSEEEATTPPDAGAAAQ